MYRRQISICAHIWFSNINLQSLSTKQKIASKAQPVQKKIKKTKKNKKIIKKTQREISLYSPEYLAKKHGINLNEVKDIPKTSQKISLGFYGNLIIFIILVIVFSRSLFFFQDFIIQKLPFTEFYFKNFFESIKNLFEIWKNLISSY